MFAANRIVVGDCRQVLERWVKEGIKVQMCVTSPPYYNLRDYATGKGNQIGLEKSPEDFVRSLVTVFSLVRQVLNDDGTIWLNLGDSYGDNKQLLGIPWRVALALQEDGWILRQDIVWSKIACMPESVKDRCTRSHEYIFLLAKQEKYYFNSLAISEPAETAGAVHIVKKSLSARSARGRGIKPSGNAKEGSVVVVGARKNKRSVWGDISPHGLKGNHTAAFPPALISPCILAGSKKGDIVLDPFMGAGTTAIVCNMLRRKWLGIEINEEYKKAADRRISVGLSADSVELKETSGFSFFK